MTVLTHAVLADAIKAIPGDEYEPKSYSGRGMYGRRCVSVAADGSAFSILGEIVRSLGALDLSGQETADLAAEIIHGAKADQMGLGVVVYWPDVVWKESDATADAEE